MKDPDGLVIQLAHERADLLARVKELEADCAAMIKVIEVAGSHDHSDGDEKDCVLCAAVNSVLDKPNPGKYLLDQLHQRDTAIVEAREALEWMKSHPHSGPNDELDSHYTDLCHECQMIDHALSQIQACEVKR